MWNGIPAQPTRGPGAAAFAIADERFP